MSLAGLDDSFDVGFPLARVGKGVRFRGVIAGSAGGGGRVRIRARVSGDQSVEDVSAGRRLGAPTAEGPCPGLGYRTLIVAVGACPVLGKQAVSGWEVHHGKVAPKL